MDESRLMLMVHVYCFPVFRLKATKDLKKVIDCLNHRKLSIHYKKKKTSFIHFSINKDDNNHDELKLCFREREDNCRDSMCHEIYRVSSMTYLGLVFDKNMKWHLHVNNIVMRLRTLSFSFFKLRTIRPVQVIRVIYLSLFQSIFQYDLLVCGGGGGFK